MVYVDRQATRIMRSGGSWHITSRCQPGHLAKDSSEKTPRLQGPGTAEYDGVARPGTDGDRTQHAEEACGRLERSRSLRSRMRWRVYGLSCADGLPTSGAWPTTAMEDMRAARRLPAWATAGKGPIAPGRSRGQNQQVPSWLIVLIAPSSGRHTLEKCLEPRRIPGAQQHRFQQ